MVCFKCGGDTVVTNSRLQKRTNGVWRRRRCILCDTIFTTIEAIDHSKNVHVAPAAGEHKTAAQPFSRDKLFMSLYKSLGHRSTALPDASTLTDALLPQIMGRLADGRKDAGYTVARADIIAVVIPVLTRFDKLAGQHYAAMHRVYPS